MSDICHLSSEEVGAWTEYGTRPDHSKHHHTSFQVALELIRLDLYREIDGLPAIAEQTSNDRVWRGRSSQGYTVRQLVRMVGNAHGKRKSDNDSGAEERRPQVAHESSTVGDG